MAAPYSRDSDTFSREEGHVDAVALAFEQSSKPEVVINGWGEVCQYIHLPSEPDFFLNPSIFNGRFQSSCISCVLRQSLQSLTSLGGFFVITEKLTSPHCTTGHYGLSGGYLVASQPPDRPQSLKLSLISMGSRSW